MTSTKHTAMLACALMIALGTTPASLAESECEVQFRDKCVVVPDLPDVPGLGDGIELGEWITTCHVSNAVCAVAAASMKVEKVADAPNMAYHMTLGGGMSNVPYPGEAEYETTLGSGSCSFPANSGCAEDFTDIANAGDPDSCKYATVESTATAALNNPDPGSGAEVDMPFALAYASDSICEGAA